jgi:phosphopantothenoylcysteine decarboxylase/phosphopantothenate--cysteine ligase
MDCGCVILSFKVQGFMAIASTIRCLITAGPTREYLDPVRFLSNPSSGKMGFALAEAALERGWTVDLVAGPVALTEPDGAILYPVETAEEMFHQVDALFDVCDILIMTAAVSDFRPRQRLPRKVKKEEAELVVELERTPDILAAMAERKAHQLMVGFAAESENLESYARAKLLAKQLDWIVANDISVLGQGFAADDNQVLLLGASGARVELGPDRKRVIAGKLLSYFVPEVD